MTTLKFKYQQLVDEVFKDFEKYTGVLLNGLKATKINIPMEENNHQDYLNYEVSTDLLTVLILRSYDSDGSDDRSKDPDGLIREDGSAFEYYIDNDWYDYDGEAYEKYFNEAESKLDEFKNQEEFIMLKALITAVKCKGGLSYIKGYLD